MPSHESVSKVGCYENKDDVQETEAQSPPENKELVGLFFGL